MTDIDRIRAVLDKCADDTAPGENDYMGTYDEYEAAIDAISRIAYPESVGDEKHNATLPTSRARTRPVWRLGHDGKIRPDPPPTEAELFADDGVHDIMVRQAGGDWEHAGTRRNTYLAQEFANSLMPNAYAVRVRKRRG